MTEVFLFPTTLSKRLHRLVFEKCYTHPRFVHADKCTSMDFPDAMYDTTGAEREEKYGLKRKLLGEAGGKIQAWAIGQRKVVRRG